MTHSQDNVASAATPPPSVDVSVILVNYNGLKHLEYCIPALLLSTDVSFEIVVVDNSSTDGSTSWISQTYPDIRLIELDDNMGFGYANQKGIEAARSEFVALLNTDTEVTPSWLSALLKTMKNAPDIAATCAELRLRAQPEIINARGGGMTWIGIGYDKKLGHPASGEQSNACSDTLFPTAAAMLMRRSAYDDVGGFDPDFFMYHEDVDLGWRFWLGGYRVLYCPQSLVYHQFGGTTSTSQSAEFSFKLGLRHCVRSLIKNYSLPYVVTVVPLFFLTLLLRGQTHKWGHIIRWNLRHWKSTMAARSAIQKTRKITDRAIFQKGLISFPLPFPRQPQTVMPGRYMPAVEGLLINHVLDVTKGSSDGRLGMGWSPRGANRESRTILGQALCTLRVEPKCRGSLRITLHRPVDCEGVFLSVNQKGETELVSPSTTNDQPGTCQESGWGRYHLPEVKSSDVGGLQLEFRSAGTGHPSIQSIRFIPDEPLAFPETFSVVIPTYDRLDCLTIVLAALEKQTLLPDEVVVVDDGSQDDTWTFLQQWLSEEGNFRRRAFHQKNCGPATARNRGVAEATAEYVVFLGDDTIPRADFLAAHCKAHREQGRGNAIVGHTAWDSDDIVVTPFMDYINNYGAQFGYALVPPETEATYHFFYTSNISVARQALVDFPFDETFSHAGWEDTELGYRLGVAGQRIIYYPTAITAHRHAHSVNTFTRRQELMGTLSLNFADKCPALKAAMVPVKTIGNRASLILGKPCEWLQPAVHALDQKGVRIPRAFWERYLRYFFLKGFFREEKNHR